MQLMFNTWDELDGYRRRGVPGKETFLEDTHISFWITFLSLLYRLIFIDRMAACDRQLSEMAYYNCMVLRP